MRLCTLFMLVMIALPSCTVAPTRSDGVSSALVDQRTLYALDILRESHVPDISPKHRIASDFIATLVQLVSLSPERRVSIYVVGPNLLFNKALRDVLTEVGLRSRSVDGSALNSQDRMELTYSITPVSSETAENRRIYLLKLGAVRLRRVYAENDRQALPVDNFMISGLPARLVRR